MIKKVKNKEYDTFYEFERDYLNPQVPVIITNAIDNWPAISLWTNTYLKDKYGDRMVPIHDTQSGIRNDQKLF